MQRVDLYTSSSQNLLFPFSLHKNNAIYIIFFRKLLINIQARLASSQAIFLKKFAHSLFQFYPNLLQISFDENCNNFQ
jgi:hypothetical protein